ncbi:hypothetical protein FE784_00570 [Paenibacillus hemerocallicola]|uniref:Uncharacterized protein n=1 Tax=Paenibacillus hemerocallicola TaxID=1172614 RepID=A0A5C4TGG5_9BACL|nr:hypothetical protein [Paenibacillus hemerocallicola]TNJ68193.1 hypothetical protein FE784_00570 [Paenibacillus hemerocallicola]
MLELCAIAETNRRIELLDSMVLATAYRPEWFDSDVLPAARDWLEGEIAQLEAELLARIESENEKSRLAGRLIEKQANIITPSIPQWRKTGKGDIGL